MEEKSTQKFGKIRSYLWPIHTYELKKILPMSLMFFFISLNYSLLRNAKDPLIQYAPQSSTEVIPFLKFWGIIPAAIIFTFFYSKLSNMLKKETLFYITVFPFMIFFIAFALYLYPNSDSLALNSLADAMVNYSPDFLQGVAKSFSAIFRNWVLSLFYIFSELWGSIALSLLFWGFANDITKTVEAKRFYAVFGLGANVALIASGFVGKYIRTLGESFGYADQELWTFILNSIVSLTTISTILIMVLYRYVNTQVLTDSRFYSPEEIKPKKKKAVLSLKESFGILLRSAHLFYITVLVFAYGVCIVLVEIIWKKKAEEYFPDPADYNNFLNNYSILTGVTTVLIMLLVTSQSLRRFGWGPTAMITPAVISITGVGFFSFIIFPDVFEPILNIYGITALVVAVVMGTLQTACIKATKYSLFDPTKEMAYIPLDEDSKVKGKAAIDVVGSRFGKASGSLIIQFLIGAFGSVILAAPCIAAILAIVLASWILAVGRLDKSLKSMSAN